MSRSPEDRNVRKQELQCFCFPFRDRPHGGPRLRKGGTSVQRKNVKLNIANKFVENIRDFQRVCNICCEICIASYYVQVIMYLIHCCKVCTMHLLSVP
jgi:hypothetical protein